MINKTPVRLCLNVIVVTLILTFATHKSINESKAYLDSVFAIFDRTLQDVGYSNLSDARAVQAVLDGRSKIGISAEKLSKTELHYYRERHEYGFNQGVYPTASANGTLIGFGRPPLELLHNSERFLVLDKIWNRYRKDNKFDHHFLANYRYQFVYSSTLRNYENRVRFLQEGSINPDRYRAGLGDLYKKELDENGFYFTLPYPDYLSSEMVFSAITPIYSGGKHLYDIGIDVDLEAIKTIINLYPDIDDYIKINLRFRSSDFRAGINDPKYSTFDVFHYYYDIPNLGKVVAHYDLMYFVNQLFPLFCILVMLSVIFHITWLLVQRQKHEKLSLKKQLTLDSMTGLFNRRILDESVVRRIEEYCTNNMPVCVIAIDANKFKQINDTYGHQVGDKAILHIAQCLKKCTRQTDYCIRMGGDEFLVVLMNASFDKAVIVSKRLEETISNEAIDTVGVDVSITTAVTLVKGSETFDEVYKRVDDLLYQKKENPIL